MKTRRTLLYILTAVLSVFGVQTAGAQTAQDALYIFRNDGKFNAFFYGDIDHIEYSMVDTLGKTQKDYVVQEIYALDSVFRIPLSAIDSVAFVTPKTVYKKDVVRPDKKIADYIIASDTINWIRLAKNTPASMIPKKGDKFLIEEASKFIPSGFGGKVTNVKQESSGSYTVTAEALELTDLYDRLLVKGAAVTEDANDAKETRGVTDGTYNDYEDKWDLGVIDEVLTIKGSQSIIEGMNGNASLAIDGEGTIKYHLTPKFVVRAFFFLDAGEGVKSNVFVKMTTDARVNGEVSGALTAHVDIPFALATNKTSLVKGFGKEVGGKYPLVFDFSAGAYLEASQGVTTKFSWEGGAVMGYNATYTKLPLKEGVYNKTTSLNATPQKPDVSYALGYFSLGSGLYLKGEVKFNNKAVKEEEFQLGLRGNFAYKISVNAGKAALNISDNLWQTNTDRVYSAVNYDDIIIVSNALEGQFYAKLFKTTFGPYAGEFPLFALGFPAVPEFQSFKMQVNEKAPSLFKFTSLISREQLIPAKVGYAVFQTSDNKVASEWWYDKEFKKEEFSTYSHEFDDLEIGYTYVAMPLVSFMKKGIVVTDVQKIYFDLGTPKIEVDKEVEVVADSGHKDVFLKTNIPNMEFKSDASWLTTEWTRKDGNLRLNYQKLPADMQERKAKIHVTGKTLKGDKVLLETDITVTQCKAYLELSATKLDFDAKGGQKTAKVTKTNLTNIKVFTTTEDFKAAYSNNTITVTATENKSTDSRVEKVYVEGQTAGGQKFQTTIDVVQAAANSGGGNDPGTSESYNGMIKLDFRCYGIDSQEKIYQYTSWESKTTIDSDGDEVSEYGVWWDSKDKADIVVTPKGSGYTITATKSTIDPYGEGMYGGLTRIGTITFDVDQLSRDADGFIQCSNMKNLKITRVENYNLGDVHTWEIEIDELPVNPNYQLIGRTNKDRFSWRGNGVYIKRFVHHAVRSNGTIQQHTDTYNEKYKYPNGMEVENFFTISMDFLEDIF